jgi:hypothetical protein
MHMRQGMEGVTGQSAPRYQTVTVSNLLFSRLVCKADAFIQLTTDASKHLIAGLEPTPVMVWQGHRSTIELH